MERENGNRCDLFQCTGAAMTEEELANTIKLLLKKDTDLSFLLTLKRGEPERLVACIRDRIDRAEYQ